MKQTICPKHALLAEQDDNYDTRMEVTCYHAGCHQLLENMFEAGAYWDADDQPQISELFIQRLFDKFVA